MILSVVWISACIPSSLSCALFICLGSSSPSCALPCASCMMVSYKRISCSSMRFLYVKPSLMCLSVGLIVSDISILA